MCDWRVYVVRTRECNLGRLLNKLVDGTIHTRFFCHWTQTLSPKLEDSMRSGIRRKRSIVRGAYMYGEKGSITPCNVVPARLNALMQLHNAGDDTVVVQ